jgi:hypothetical protein
MAWIDDGERVAFEHVVGLGMAGDRFEEARRRNSRSNRRRTLTLYGHGLRVLRSGAVITFVDVNAGRHLERHSTWAFDAEHELAAGGACVARWSPRPAP